VVTTCSTTVSPGMIAAKGARKLTRVGGIGRGAALPGAALADSTRCRSTRCGLWCVCVRVYVCGGGGVGLCVVSVCGNASRWQPPGVCHAATS
jgi:hypothetical protein